MQVHQQLLAGCFGLGTLSSEGPCTQLYHYLDAVRAASQPLQMQIRCSVHQIYTLLISSLSRGRTDLPQYNGEQLLNECYTSCI